MRIVIDTNQNSLTMEAPNETKNLDLYSDEAFDILTQEWVKLGWNQKYSYSFTWLGRPIIQLPEDMLRTQEVIYRLKPDVIVETGIAHGGSLIFYASLCQMMAKGRIIGIDCEIRPQNRAAIENHPLANFITLIEGDSVGEQVVSQVKSLIKPNETVMVILDSNHSYAHVMAELKAYADLVTSGSYLLVTDGIMKDLTKVPNGFAHWERDNPTQAALDFVAQRKDFVIEQPKWEFKETQLSQNITYYPQGWLRKI